VISVGNPLWAALVSWLAEPPIPMQEIGAVELFVPSIADRAPQFPQLIIGVFSAVSVQASIRAVFSGFIERERLPNVPSYLAGLSGFACSASHSSISAHSSWHRAESSGEG
jgi:hypothetical protein